MSTFATEGSWYYVVITGASKGFGKALAESFSKSIDGPLHIVLTGRVTDDLEEVRNIVIGLRANKLTKCEILSIDLSDLRLLETSAKRLFQLESEIEYSNMFLANNAGSLGPLTVIGNHDISDISLATDFNITSFCYLTSYFIEKVVRPSSRAIIVNTSSLAAIQPFLAKGIYCATKAAREMYLRVLAEENKGNDNIKILNYAPGPLDTAMQKEIREREEVHAPVREAFIALFVEGKLVKPEDSADKCVSILLRNLFVSGSHIDYFDEIDV